jgi:phage-related protein
VYRAVRPISWIKAARKDFQGFPLGAKDDLLDALSAVAEGGMPNIAKPLKGLGSGVLELALRHRKDAFRVVYTLQSEQIYGSSTPSRKNRRPELRRSNLKLI